MMDSLSEVDGAPADDLQPIAERLKTVGDLIRTVVAEVGPGTLHGAEAAIEAHRAAVYAAMEALGRTAHEFVQSGPSPERQEAAQRLVIDVLREISLTSPIGFYAAQGKRRRLSYYELVRHMRAGRAAGADLPARILDDYYVHTYIGQAFLNRLNLIGRRLIDEAARCLASGEGPVHLVSLQYIGGADLLPLARAVNSTNALQVTCLDESVDAVRDGEQTLKPAFGARAQCRKADAGTWLHGPACARGSVCLVYAASLIEHLPSKQVVRVLQGAHRALWPGGALLMGATPGRTPVAEQMIRDWLLGWDWTYRSEDEWRELFAQTPFGAEELTFEYEPLGIDALIRAEKAA